MTEEEALLAMAGWRFKGGAAAQALHPYLLALSSADLLRLGEFRARGTLALLRLVEGTHTLSERAFFPSALLLEANRMEETSGKLELGFAALVYLGNLAPAAHAHLRADLENFSELERSRLLAEAERLVELLRRRRAEQRRRPKALEANHARQTAQTFLQTDLDPHHPPAPRRQIR